MTLVLVAAAMLLVAGRAWTHPSPLWLRRARRRTTPAARRPGSQPGQRPPSPRRPSGAPSRVRPAGRRPAGRRPGHATPGWAPWAVGRRARGGWAARGDRALSDAHRPGRPRRAVCPPGPGCWPWSARCCRHRLGALLSQVLRVDALLWALAIVAGVLRYACWWRNLSGRLRRRRACARARLVAGRATNVSGWHPVLRPHPVPTQAVLPRRDAHDLKVWSGSRLMFTGVGALVALGLSFALVALALRRFRRRPPPRSWSSKSARRSPR